MVNMSSSSSSEDEQDEKLKEALAPGFVINASELKEEEQKKTKIESLPSLRTRVDCSASSSRQFLGPEITPEQRKFVANKLDSFLEKQLVEADILPKKWRGSCSPQVIDSVKLLSTSCDSLQTCDTKETVQVKKRTKLKRKIFEKSDMTQSEMLREAAVSPEWVLKEQGVFGKMCHKGEVITGAVHAWDIKKT